MRCLRLGEWHTHLPFPASFWNLTVKSFSFSFKTDVICYIHSKSVRILNGNESLTMSIPSLWSSPVSKKDPKFSLGTSTDDTLFSSIWNPTFLIDKAQSFFKSRISKNKSIHWYIDLERHGSPTRGPRSLFATSRGCSKGNRWTASASVFVGPFFPGQSHRLHQHPFPATKY